MVENKNSGSYEVTERQAMNRKVQQMAWCQIGLVPYMTVIAFMVYIIGSIITGVTYRSYGLNLNCTDPYRFQPTEMFVYQSPMVVVGPCFMSAGGAILLYLLFQWFMCRPSIK